MLQYRHRDKLARVIQQNDYVVWANGKYGTTMTICSVIGATEEKVAIRKENGKTVRVYPNNLLVITAQVMQNINENVGANL